MCTLEKLGLTALMAALMLASAVGTASARSFSISNQSYRVTWSRLEFASTIVTVSCQVTLEGSFAGRTIAKVFDSLIGSVTRITTKPESCTNGRVTATNPPWHAVFDGFEGTLPNISDILLLLSGIQLTIDRPGGFNITCRYGIETDNVWMAAALNASKEFTTLTPVSGNTRLHLLEGPGGGFGCIGSGNLAGAAADGTITLLGSTTRITLRLI